nr:retrovirus-related Pol polyprotein from transposon TNT 1-94 [Tanacetum cinerariifolium]
MSSFYEFVCYGCGGPSNTPLCYLCTCEQCGNILIHGTCLKCNSGAGNSFTYDPIPESFNEVQIIPNPPPQSHFNIYLCQICESNSHYGYECLQRILLVYEPEPCYNQNFSNNAYTHDLPGVTPLIDHHCCYKCGDSLNDFFCHQCTCEFCGNGAHDGYNCPSQNLVPNPSESEDLSDNECDVPACDDFTTFSNILFDADDDFSSSDNKSFSDEDISKKIYSSPLFDEEIISMKIDPHHFNAESDLIESLLNHDSSIIYSSSLKIDSLLDEFAGELILLKTIPPEIDETDCNPEEEVRLIEKLLYDNSSPRPPKEFIFENSDSVIESFSPIPVEDSDSFMKEIDLSFTPDDPMPPKIKEDDYDSKRDIKGSVKPPAPDDMIVDSLDGKIGFTITLSAMVGCPFLSVPRLLVAHRSLAGEYSQWRERFMNYLEEQTDGEAMINSIQNGDQPLPVIAQVSLTGNAHNTPPTFKDPNNETAKDLWDALERQMRGSEYGEQDRKAAILYEYETFKAIEGEQLLDTYLHYLQVINDLKKCGYKKDNCDVNDSLGYKKKAVVVTSNPLALVAEKTNITALLAKAFNRRKFYSKPINNNLRTSSTSHSANKKQEFVKPDDKKDDEKKRDMSKVKCYNCKKEGHFSKDCKKANVKDYNYYKTKMLLAKKDSDEQVLLAEDQAWMESSSDSDQEINANMVFMAQIEKEKEHLFDKLIRKFNHKIAKCQKRIEKANQQSKDFENQNKDLQEKYDVLMNQVNTFGKQNNEFNEQIKVLNKKNADFLDQTKVLKDQLQVKHVVIDTHVECHEKYAKLEEERYEYMIRYSALFNNDKQHRKQIADQEVLFDKMSVELVELDKHVRDLKNTVLEKDFKISELEECVCNKDLEIEKCLERLNVCENKLLKMGQTNQTVHMIMPSKYNLYNGQKRIGFENPSYFEKAKDLRLTLYDEKVIGLGYTLMFLTHSNEALEIEKFKRSRENKIEFAYDYGNLNASYVNEKINFSDDYFQEIINPDFEKIDSPFQQTSSLKPYVLNVILEKIIIDLEDEVVSLLEKEKANLKTFESLKLKGYESSENDIFESENQSENDCLVIEKECDKVENPKVIAPGMSKLSVSQSVSPMSMSKTSCDSKNVESKLKRKRREISSAYVCNDAMNVSCNSRMCDLFDDNNFFIFDDESVRISPVSKMPSRKKPCVSMNACSKSNSNKYLPRTVHKWLPKLKPLAEPVAKWIPRIVQTCLWIIDSGCSKHMTGNHALLTNFVETFLGTVRFGNNDFAVIAGYGDVVIGSMTIKKVYDVEGLVHNLFSVG